MATDWAELAKQKAADILPVIAATTRDTALALLRDLLAAGFDLSAGDDGKSLAIKPAGRLTEDQRKQVKRHKEGLLAILKPRPLLTIPTTWEQERDLEMDELRRMIAACPAPKTISLLSSFTLIRPANEAEWIEQGMKIAQEKIALKHKGELPPLTCSLCVKDGCCNGVCVREAFQRGEHAQQQTAKLPA